MEQKTRLSGRVAARITSRGPALEMQEHGKSLLRNILQKGQSVLISSPFYTCLRAEPMQPPRRPWPPCSRGSDKL
jgi:hypothetical protein